MPGIGDTILAAFLARRAVLLSGASDAIRVVGSRFSPESLRLREFLARNRIPHQWMDADRDEHVDRLLQEFGVAATELPVVVASGEVLRQPTPGELASYLGLTVDNLPDRCFDLLVVGGGPGGLAAAVYGASEGLRTLLVEMVAVGGQAATTSRIENYLGFPTGISGGDLTQRAMVQAEKFGARLTSPCAATGLREEAGHLVVHLADGTDVAGRAVIVASGARYRRLDVARLDDFEGNGVYYAATAVEAQMCANDPVAIVGAGNSAGQAAVFLAENAGPVRMLVRGPNLERTMSRYLVDQIEAAPAIDLRTGCEVRELHGNGALEGLTFESTATGDRETVDTRALFVFIGADPCTAWLGGQLAVDEDGFVTTGADLQLTHLDPAGDDRSRPPFLLETSRPGVFAVGDVRAGSIKRVASAVGEGAMAVRLIHQYLAQLQGSAA
jgi:thioredoxin reductase (NADPH)